jgi:hypothetical protein
MPGLMGPNGVMGNPGASGVMGPIGVPGRNGAYSQEYCLKGRFSDYI